MSTSHACRILHIDDNPRDIELMQLAFDDIREGSISYDGYTDPVVGVDRLTRETTGLPTIVILDLNMPVLNGLQILERWRKDPHLSGIRMIVFTTSRSPAERAQCLALGATEVIAKPTSFADLVGVAKSILAYC